MNIAIAFVGAIVLATIRSAEKGCRRRGIYRDFSGRRSQTQNKLLKVLMSTRAYAAAGITRSLFSVFENEGLIFDFVPRRGNLCRGELVSSRCPACGFA